jgi:hypothetical protein
LEFIICTGRPDVPYRELEIVVDEEGSVDEDCIDWEVEVES